jgi:hypothetical protein
MTYASETSLRSAYLALEARALSDALVAFRQAELAGAPPDACAGGRWTAHMLEGNFAAAWRESDSIRRRGAPDPHRFWLGEDLQNRRVILRCLHGYGDAVQFLRYAPRLRALAANLVIEVAPAMVELAPLFDGVDAVSTWDADAVAEHTWDVQAEVVELPYIFRTEASELPLAESYLRLPAEAVYRAGRVMGSSRHRRVGVVWAAGEWNRSRSIPLPLLQPVLECPGCEFWNLQGGTARREWRSGAEGPHFRDAAGCAENMLGLAAMISQLDLVITVDTLAAHLAGAMGKPAWVLLQYAADWRWMIGRCNSPWYPSLRLFRQPTPGDWSSPIRFVAGELEHWLSERSRASIRTTAMNGSSACSIEG